MKITLANLAEATEQQIFDQVAAHLLKQGVRSVDTSAQCLYRGPNGLMCAAGCLIADEEYKPRFDELGSWGMLIENGHVTAKHEYFIMQLQRLHDNKRPSQSYHELLVQFTKDHRLDGSVLNQEAAQ